MTRIARVLSDLAVPNIFRLSRRDDAVLTSDSADDHEGLHAYSPPSILICVRNALLSALVRRRARACCRTGRPVRLPIGSQDRCSCRSVAVEVGFEPTEGLPLHTLSRRAPSATRRLHRRRAYLTGGRSQQGSRCSRRFHRAGRPGLAPPGEELAQQVCTLLLQHAADHLHVRGEPAVAQHVP